jgi:hypothetical protein
MPAGAPGQSDLDEEQHFEAATSHQVRDELQELRTRDLLGPWGGHLETLPERSPGPEDRYLVGRLGPKRAATDSRDPENQQVTDAENAAAGDNDPELPEVHTAQDAGRMWASSMGLSCVVDGVDTVTVVAEWGSTTNRNS